MARATIEPRGPTWTPPPVVAKTGVDGGDLGGQHRRAGRRGMAFSGGDESHRHEPMNLKTTSARAALVPAGSRSVIAVPYLFVIHTSIIL